MSSDLRNAAFAGFVEGPQAVLVVGKRDRVEHASQPRSVVGELIGEPLDLILELDVADENPAVSHEAGDLLAAGFGADRVNHVRSGRFEQACRVKRHALLVGDSHHEETSAGHPEKVGGHGVPRQRSSAPR